MSGEPLTQIHIGRGPNGYEVVSSVQANKDFYKWESETLKAQLMRLCPPRLWPHGSYNNSCPRPILINIQHQLLLRELHTALTASVTDIVNRWWFDKAAEFPKRMPLGEKEQELLKVSMQFLKSHLLVANKKIAVRRIAVHRGNSASLCNTQRIVEA